LPTSRDADDVSFADDYNEQLYAGGDRTVGR
jgi:hypothetical protein